jgi:hypothetical protein
MEFAVTRRRFISESGRLGSPILVRPLRKQTALESMNWYLSMVCRPLVDVPLRIRRGWSQVTDAFRSTLKVGIGLRRMPWFLRLGTTY